MEYATFREWLTEHGGRFDNQHEERGQGNGTVTIYREGRMRTVDESLVDHNGRIVLDSGIEGVKFLKELDAVGHAEAPRHVNLKHTTLLANAGLVTRATGSSPGMV